MQKLAVSFTWVGALVLSLATAIGIRQTMRPPASTRARPLAAAPSLAETSAAASCETRRQALLNQPALSGIPRFEATRYEILARARAEPIVFLEPPTAGTLPADLVKLRERLHTARSPWAILHDVLTQLKERPQQLRQVILTDGYLYAENPALAALYASLSLTRLFNEAELDVTRGADTRRAVKKGQDYIWADGPEAGRSARLWLFDRVAVHGEALSRPKHLSVVELQRQISADRIEIDSVRPEGAVATLVYGIERVPALLSVEGGRFNLDCEVIHPNALATIEAARAFGQRRQRVIDRLRSVVSEQVAEELPFDEPKTEEGQQDGQLRPRWRAAYQSGQPSFEFNGDEYPVFGAGGIPRIPQVCVDFITDSWERLGGTRWTRRDEGRLRHIGRLDMDAMGVENRRSVASLVEFTAAHSEWFDTLVIPESERVRFADRSSFFQNLFKQRANFQPGDVVAILGPRTDEKLHYHSFFILASDPVTGMPTLVAANAGRPRIRTWEGEMQNAPLRSIVARIRPKLEWLERIAEGGESPQPVLASL